jgi:hypothetical protein
MIEISGDRRFFRAVTQQDRKSPSELTHLKEDSHIQIMVSIEILRTWWPLNALSIGS